MESVETPSSVDLLALYTNWLRVRAGWEVALDVLENHFLKALHQNGGECHRAVIV